MSVRRLFSMLLGAVLVLSCLGCGTPLPAVPVSDADTAYPSAESASLTQDIEAIRDRGYVLFAIKDENTAFRTYDETNETYDGAEVRLAYRIAAKLFDVPYSDAVSRELAHFIEVSDANRIEILTSHSADYVISSFARTEAREQSVAFSDCYYTDALSLMINRSDGGYIHSLSDLSDLTVGVVEGSTAPDGLKQSLAALAPAVTPKIRLYSDYADVSAALAAGKVDAFCADNTILAQFRTDERLILSDRFAPQHYCVAVPIGSDGLLETANLVIAECTYSDEPLFE